MTKQMNEQPATYKQIMALKKFNVPGAEDFSKQDAIEELGKLFDSKATQTEVPVEKPKMSADAPGVDSSPDRAFVREINKSKASMYVSYAKDIFCALVTQSNEQIKTGGDIMHTAIELVKQAKEAFE